ncbi:MAG: adenosylmethionine--8-amino-7-oxononanoate transaminase [Clostridium sp.]|nr:adenosylmethionine--8-amino-7-oxononanoate transaminase [Clostridium sp.]
MQSKENWLEKDLKYVWHPDTQMKQYEGNDFKPTLIDKGKGIYVYDTEGKRYIDGVSSWWVNTLGHSNKRLNQVLLKQAEKIEHVLLADFTHKPAIELAERLVKLAGKPFSKVFYSDDGSTAVEVAIKMAYQYWYQKGKPEKKHFVSMTDSYHGDTLGSVSVGGIDIYKKIFNPLVFETLKVCAPYCYRCPKNCPKENCSIECIKEVEALFEKRHSEIAAMIVEPLVQGAAGMRVYPVEYLKKLRTLCDRYDILLIDDEVAMAFGRTGKYFAFEHAGIKPDIFCVAKGITAGYIPLAATITTDKIYKEFYDDFSKLKTFYHGHSFTGNPIACAIAVETLKIMEEEKIIENLYPKIEKLKTGLEQFKQLEHVGDIRHIGMIGAIELVEDKTTKQPYPFTKRIGHQVFKKAMQSGAILRPIGNVIYFMPPLIITEEEIATLLKIAYNSIKSVTQE